MLNILIKNAFKGYVTIDYILANVVQISPTVRHHGVKCEKEKNNKRAHDESKRDSMQKKEIVEKQNLIW